MKLVRLFSVWNTFGPILFPLLSILLNSLYKLNVSLFYCRGGAFVGPATKVFLCDDLTGQNYLCYLLPSKQQLSMVKLDFSSCENFIFGVFTSISAKDAVPVPVSRNYSVRTVFTVAFVAFTYASDIGT